MLKPNKRNSQKRKTLWSKKVTSAKTSQKEYSIEKVFLPGDLIGHNFFGEGIVEAAHGDKIEVLFEDRVRVLIHGKRPLPEAKGDLS